jgi:hypothetical protein
MDTPPSVLDVPMWCLLIAMVVCFALAIVALFGRHRQFYPQADLWPLRAHRGAAEAYDAWYRLFYALMLLFLIGFGVASGYWYEYTWLQIVSLLAAGAWLVGAIWPALMEVLEHRTGS